MAGAKIALAGLGAWGANHLRVWSSLGCLRAICDADASRLQTASQRFPQLQCHSSLDELLAGSEVDAVVIATPASTHAELALQCLEAGKDVLIEKPMALRVAEGEAIVEAARRQERLVAVGHVLLYHPAVRKLESLIREGALGRVLYVYSHRLNLGRIRTEENALWSFAPHDIGMMLHLLGAMPREVSCRGGSYLNHDVADVTLTTLDFDSKVQSHIFVSWLHPFKEQRFIVVGERQMAVFDDSRPWPEKLLLYPHRVDWIQGQSPIAQRGEPIAVPLEVNEALTQECAHFLECVETRRRPLADGEHGLAVLRVLEAAQRSLEGGGAAQGFDELPRSPSRPPQAPPVAPKHFVHESAIVHPSARLGAGSKVWHFSHVMAGAEVGENSMLGQNVLVGPKVRIGKRVKIQNNVSVYQGVELEDDVFCGPSMVFTNVHNPRSFIERKAEFAPTRVKRGASLGANCTIRCGATIGEYAFVGASALVTHDVPDYALVYGQPARRQGWVSECGEKLIPGEGEGSFRCPCCPRRYRQQGETLRPEASANPPCPRDPRQTS